jgi:preprotein translocase subunit SecG
MSGFLLGFFTVVLVLASLFMIFVVLLQRGSDGGAGSAFGGGMAESAFGGETSKVLSRATVTTAIIFFVVGLGLYLGQIAAHKKEVQNKIALEAIVAKAQQNVDAQAAAKTKEEAAANPKPGEATAQAMKVLAAETKQGASVQAVKPVMKAEMIDGAKGETVK